MKGVGPGVAVELRCSFNPCSTLLAVGYCLEPEGGLYGWSAGKGHLESRSVGRERTEFVLTPSSDRPAYIEPCPRHNTTVEPETTRTRIKIRLEWADVAEAVEKFKNDRRRQVVRIGIAAPARAWVTDRIKGFD